MTTEDLKGNLEKIYSKSVSITLTKEADTWIHIHFFETGVGRKARVSFDEYRFEFEAMPPLKKEEFVMKTVETLRHLRQEKEWLLDIGFDCANNHYYKLHFNLRGIHLVLMLERYDNEKSIAVSLMKRDGNNIRLHFATTSFQEALQEYLSRNAFQRHFKLLTGVEEGWMYLPSKLRDLTING